MRYWLAKVATQINSTMARRKYDLHNLHLIRILLLRDIRNSSRKVAAYVKNELSAREISRKVSFRISILRPIRGTRRRGILPVPCRSSMQPNWRIGVCGIL